MVIFNSSKNVNSIMRKIFNDKPFEYHLGKMLQASLSKFSNEPHQIDVLTGQMETHGSVLDRAVRFSKVLQKLGIRKGDVIATVGPNHMDISIPLFSALFIGAITFPMDMQMEIEDFKLSLQAGQPKVIFCQAEKVTTVKAAMSEAAMNADVISFGQTGDSSVTTFEELMKIDTADVQFKIQEINPSEDGAVILGTSGSTGLPKGVLITHEVLAFRLLNMWAHYGHSETHLKVPVASQLHWASALFSMAPAMFLGGTRLQTEQHATAEIVLKMINDYDVKMVLLGFPLVMTMVKHHKFGKTNFRNMEFFCMGGSDIARHVIDRLQAAIPNAHVVNCYGMTESMGAIFEIDTNNYSDPMSVGREANVTEVKIVDVETRERLGPNQKGEALIRSKYLLKEYYNNPTATREAFENGWLKTGDMLFYKEDGSYYYVERLKVLLKYRNYQISPQEIENTISLLPGVLEVGVTGIKVLGDGEHPVAFVVRKEDSRVTEDDIKNIVKDKLSAQKQLRGGVKFIDSLPRTSTGKIQREKLKSMAKVL